jgi:hypothetical protein
MQIDLPHDASVVDQYVQGRESLGHFFKQNGNCFWIADIALNCVNLG